MISPPGAGAARAQEEGGARRRVTAVEWLVALVLVLVVLGPLFLSRGFALVGDMVFVPEQPWKDAWTGGDGGVPRAVPGDAVVSVLSAGVGGEFLQRLALAGVLVSAFLGMCRLTEPLPLVARLAGALCFTWNPYVHERLAIGHWALLCGYAALPWVGGPRWCGCGAPPRCGPMLPSPHGWSRDDSGACCCWRCSSPGGQAPRVAC